MSNAAKIWTPESRIRLPEERLPPAAVLQRMQAAAADFWMDGRVDETWKEGGDEMPAFKQIWISIQREGLLPVLEALISIHYPHFSVIAAVDTGETVECPYIFQLYHGAREAMITIIINVVVPKTDLVLPTICHLFPGAGISEREKQEMMGIKIDGTPDARRMFLPDDFPEGVYPWRKDETAPPSNMTRQLWNTGREAYNERARQKAEREAAALEEAKQKCEESAAANSPENPETPAAAPEGEGEAAP